MKNFISNWLYTVSKNSTTRGTHPFHIPKDRYSPMHSRYSCHISTSSDCLPCPFPGASTTTVPFSGYHPLNDAILMGLPITLPCTPHTFFMKGLAVSAVLTKQSAQSTCWRRAADFIQLGWAVPAKAFTWELPGLSFGSNCDDKSLEQSVAITCVLGSPGKQI